ncbi:hypothetical protein [Sicyoidochytrium minutum DNA virus]|nr:hypothetical protein [Sicyoidochytrium minutum DNA virus]
MRIEEGSNFDGFSDASSISAREYWSKQHRANNPPPSIRDIVTGAHEPLPIPPNPHEPAHDMRQGNLDQEAIDAHSQMFFPERENEDFAHSSGTDVKGSGYRNPYAAIETGQRQKILRRVMPDLDPMYKPNVFREKGDNLNPHIDQVFNPIERKEVMRQHRRLAKEVARLQNVPGNLGEAMEMGRGVGGKRWKEGEKLAIPNDGVNQIERPRMRYSTDPKFSFRAEGARKANRDAFDPILQLKRREMEVDRFVAQSMSGRRANITDPKVRLEGDRSRSAYITEKPDFAELKDNREEFTPGWILARDKAHDDRPLVATREKRMGIRQNVKVHPYIDELPSPQYVDDSTGDRSMLTSVRVANPHRGSSRNPNLWGVSQKNDADLATRAQLFIDEGKDLDREFDLFKKLNSSMLSENWS